MSRSVKAHLLLVLITFIWGATFVLIKNALSDMSPLLLNAVRMTLAAALLAIIYHREFTRMTRPAVTAGAAVGIFLWLGYEFQTAGLKFTTPSKSAFLTGASVVFVPLCLALFWRRRINRWTIIGVIGAFIGLYLLAVPVGPNGELFSLGGINIGDALTIGCAISFTFHIILVGRATQHFPYSQIVLVQMIVGAILMVITAPVLERPMVIWSPRVLWAIIITAVFATVLAFTIQAWAQQFTPPTHTALIFALEPVFALATSYIVVGERLGLRAGFGAALILASVLVSELLPGALQNQAELVEETRNL